MTLRRTRAPLLGWFALACLCWGASYLYTAHELLGLEQQQREAARPPVWRPVLGPLHDAPGESADAGLHGLRQHTVQVASRADARRRNLSKSADAGLHGLQQHTVQVASRADARRRNLSTGTHTPGASPGGRCFSAEALQRLHRACSAQYRKPGPDALCTQDAGAHNHSALRSPWLQPLDMPPLALPTEAQARACAQVPLPHAPQRFRHVEFQCLSQNTEDGILLYLLSVLGAGSQRALEIAGGVGWENNVANLVLNFGFDALFFDGDAGNTRCARNFFRAHPATAARVDRGVWWSSAFVTVENINDLVAETTGWSGDIDVLSVDVDGVDYWLLEALRVVRPRIVVVEVQELWGAGERRTRPYRADHRSPEIAAMGASLAAYEWLLEHRGYRLVGCIARGFNAFFVREDARAGGLDAVFGRARYDAAGCFAHVDAAWGHVLAARRRAADKYDWVDPAQLAAKREWLVNSVW
jgi:hypothetical protein